MKYAKLLGDRIQKGSNRKDKNINVWLVNTGWSGGPYGVGNRLELTFTRSMISAALNGQLSNVEFRTEPFFGLHVPLTCPDVPNAILNPRETWRNEDEYDQRAKELEALFETNFAQYREFYEEETS